MKGRGSMNVQRRDFLLLVTLAAAAAMPALAQTVTPTVGPASGATNGAASIPDFSRVWFHPSFPWFEPPASGPGPVTNKSRWPQQPGGDSVSGQTNIDGSYTKRPVVEVELSRGTQRRKFLALIDSGADQIMMPSAIAEALGIDRERSARRT